MQKILFTNILSFSRAVVAKATYLWVVWARDCEMQPDNQSHPVHLYFLFYPQFDVLICCKSSITYAVICSSIRPKWL